jgi:N5-(carboxyethyl)ornithine synthase
MNIGFIIPTYPGEKRVGLLPQHLKYVHSANTLRFEQGFGNTLGIPDESYQGMGGYTRKQIFQWAEVIYSLKTPQQIDYDLFNKGQAIVGWIYPSRNLEADLHFMTHCAKPKDLTIFDTNYRYTNGVWETLRIQSDFASKNNILAGYASVSHGILLRGGVRKDEIVTVFGSGNVALGALEYLTGRGIYPLLRRRSNLERMLDEFAMYDIFINTVSIAHNESHVVTQNMLAAMKDSGWIIDAAADENGAIEGTRCTSLDHPIYHDQQGHTFYVVNNSPSLFYRESSDVISEAYAKSFWSKPMGFWFE